MALRGKEKALHVIDHVPPQHPFEMKYDRIDAVDWESRAEVLDSQARLNALLRGWNQAPGSASAAVRSANTQR